MVTYTNLNRSISMNKTILSIISLVLLMATNLNAQNLAKELASLIKTDIHFSDFSIKHGINKAFIEFAGDSAVLLKPNCLPIVGKLAIENYHSKIDDSNISLSWHPLNAKVSKSADLGFTYGIWKLTAGNVQQEGTYVSVWHKNKDGEWKYILDSGNEGLGINLE